MQDSNKKNYHYVTLIKSMILSYFIISDTPHIDHKLYYTLIYIGNSSFFMLNEKLKYPKLLSFQTYLCCNHSIARHKRS